MLVGINLFLTIFNLYSGLGLFIYKLTIKVENPGKLLCLQVTISYYYFLTRIQALTARF